MEEITVVNNSDDAGDIKNGNILDPTTSNNINDEENGVQCSPTKETSSSENDAKSEADTDAPVSDAVVHTIANPEISDDEKSESDLVERCRGDAIGDTLYSERFVLSTLIKLTNLQTNLNGATGLETELCSLWDMTVEKDVVEYLLEQNVIDVFMHSIDSTEDERLMEILVGILGNICGIESGFKKLQSQTQAVQTLLMLTGYTDSLTLIQLMRLLVVLMAQLKCDDIENIEIWFNYFCKFPDFVKNLIHILKNTTKHELSLAALNALNAILAKCALLPDEEATEMDGICIKPKFDELFINTELVEATALAFCTCNDAIETHEQNDLIVTFININSILVQYEDSVCAYGPVWNEPSSGLVECITQVLEYAQALKAETQFIIIEGLEHIYKCLGYPLTTDAFYYFVRWWLACHERESDDSALIFIDIRQRQIEYIMKWIKEIDDEEYFKSHHTQIFKTKYEENLLIDEILAATGGEQWASFIDCLQTFRTVSNSQLIE